MLVGSVIFCMLLVLLVVLIAALAHKRIPPIYMTVFIVSFSILLAAAQWYIASTQLDVQGFAAGSRSPNYAAQYFGYVLAGLALINVGLAFIKRRWSMIILAVLLVATPILYFVSW